MLIFFILLLDIIAIYLIKNKILWQIGPTCGFNAIAYILQRRYKINPKEKYFELVNNAINDELSQIGEIFSIQNCRIIIERYTDLKCKIKSVKNKEDVLKELRNNKIILFPYLKGKTPHWGVITASQGPDYVSFYDPELPTKYAESLNTLLRLNKQVLDTYDWKIYNNLRKNKWYKLINKKFYLFLKDNYLKKENNLKTSIVNLKGQMIIIE